MSGIGGQDDDERQPRPWEPQDEEDDRPAWQRDRPSWESQWQQSSWQSQWQQEQPSWQQSQPSWQQSQPPLGPEAWPEGPRTPGSATTALILGICGLFICWPIGGTLAIVYGNKAKREIAQSNGALTGDGVATAGLVMGWISIALTLVLVLAIVAGLTL